MSELTLDTAIKHCLDVAEQNETQAEKWHKEGGAEWGKTINCRECAADHRQLAEWLRELKEAKRLLKMAVEDFKEINSDILTCKYCKCYSAETDECTFYPDDTPCEQICGWKHEGEALKLMGETNDEP